MNILFLHKDFPGPFKHLVNALASDPKNNITFITSDNTGYIKNVKKLIYQLAHKNLNNCHPYLRKHEEILLHAQAAAILTLELRKKNVKFDIIYSHPSGPGTFMKYIFPEVPMIYYAEWFNRVQGGDIGFDGNIPDENAKVKIRSSNSITLIDLYSSDACIAPTEWQKSRFPKEFHNKIKVLYDGIDTEIFRPDSSAEFTVPNKNITLTQKDEVLTFGTRGMEPYRGFPEFMEMVSTLQQKRPSLHAVITGEDKVLYGNQLHGTTYKEFILKHLNFDMNRVHFVGKMPQNSYIKLLQVSSAHVYFTYPYIISQSLLEAMSCGCSIVASNTEPVKEFVNDKSGTLFDFYNFEQFVQKIEYALDNKDNMSEIRNNARKKIVEICGLEKTIPAQIEFINKVIKRQ